MTCALHILFRLGRSRVLLALPTLLLAGCDATTGSGYSEEGGGYVVGDPRYAQPAYPNGQPAYPAGQPIYNNGQPYPYAQPVYTDPYGQVAEDYSYYPDAGVYYSNTRRDYIYPDGDHWVRRRDPPRVSTWGPAVHLWFHDSPERHHAEVQRAYPPNGRRRDSNRDRDRDDDRDHDRDQR